MSLRFNKMSIKNFGPYQMVADLSLETTPSSPVILIFGENTFGKTSLFKALRWCLYETPELNLSKSAALRSLGDYLNRPARLSGSRDMEVRIQFTYEGERYDLLRKCSFDDDMKPTVVADLRVGSKVISTHSIEAEIGRILHPQISEFFLFDGELLGDFYDKLESDRARELLKENIERVLGIPALQRAKQDVHALSEAAFVQYSKAVTNERPAKEAEVEYLKLKSDKDSKEQDKVEAETSLNTARTSLAEVSELLFSAGDLIADARELETTEATYSRLRREESDLVTEMSAIASQGWLAVVSPLLSARLLEVEAENDAASTVQESLRDARNRAELLRRRLSGGNCPSCSQILPAPESDTEDRLREVDEQIRVLEESSGTGPDFHLERSLRDLIDVDSAVSYRVKQRALDILVTNIFTARKRIETLSGRLQGHDEIQIRDLAKQKGIFEGNIRRFEARVSMIDGQIATILSKQKKLFSKLRKEEGVPPALTAKREFFAYVDDVLGATIDRYKDKTREEVEMTATSMFLSLIHDPESYKGIRIAHDYRLTLENAGGGETNTSEGGRLLVALALIGALKKAAVRGGPVVLDSPMGRLDKGHRENLLRDWVPTLGSQVILLVQSGEMTDDDLDESLAGQVSRKYTIVRPSSNHEIAEIVGVS